MTLDEIEAALDSGRLWIKAQRDVRGRVMNAIRVPPKRQDSPLENPPQGVPDPDQVRLQGLRPDRPQQHGTF
jgi:hypothetical protein